MRRRAVWEPGASNSAVSANVLGSAMLLSNAAPLRVPPLPVHHHTEMVATWRRRAALLAMNTYAPFYRERHVDKVAPPLCPPLAYATTVRNHVNVLKDTLCMEKDVENPGSFLVSFSFDADMAGSLHLCFFARLEIDTDCRVLPWLPDVHEPLQVSFDKGHGQKFKQAVGMGIYLNAFDTKLVEEEGPDLVYPLIILARTVSEHAHEGDVQEQRHNRNMQVTQAALRKKGNGHCDVRILRQILLVDDMQYELHDLYGAEGASSQSACVVCLSETREILLLPCRHMCICNLCATILGATKAMQCPLCRQHVQAVLRVKMGS
ncbi:hypothetical protein L7F22_055515 [Adiantum nelumboides]|nr:hypothetical protein [Adiantum nelumboides]MCO5601395.1 hypothetical protein [Adiantum nelumboides]